MFRKQLPSFGLLLLHCCSQSAEIERRKINYYPFRNSTNSLQNEINESKTRIVLKPMHANNKNTDIQIVSTYKLNIDQFRLPITAIICLNSTASVRCSRNSVLVFFFFCFTTSNEKLIVCNLLQFFFVQICVK